MIDLNELERLERDATPAPWMFTPSIGDHKCGYLKRKSSDGFDYRDFLSITEDGDLIVALRNAAPEMIARIRQLEAYIVQANKLLIDIDKERLAMRTALIQDCEWPEDEVDTIARRAMKRIGLEYDYIDDGFGNRWSAKCPRCGAPMQVIRPGDCRCSAECYITEDESTAILVEKINLSQSQIDGLTTDLIRIPGREEQR